MSHRRIYVHDPATGTMRPAWSENEPWGPAKAAIASYRGEIVRGLSSGKNARKNGLRKEQAA